MTELVCPNCGSDRRIISTRSTDASRRGSVLSFGGHGERSGGLSYTCLKCGFPYSNRMVKKLEKKGGRECKS